MNFIVFEGSDGVGKSTLIHEIAALLREAGKTVCVTAEPWGTVVRSLLSTAKTEREKAFLHAAARARHLHAVIEPSLASGEIVLCDRYIPSSFVYQGMIGGVGCHEINSFNASFLRPDTIFLFECEAEIVRNRIVSRGDEYPETVEQIERIQSAYRQWNYEWNGSRAITVETEAPTRYLAKKLTKEILG